MKKVHGIIAIIVCVGLCVGYYFYLSNRDINRDVTPSEVEQIIAKDLDASYPKTPREVVRFYNRILLSLYNGENLSDEQVEALGEQARKLFDEELIEKNPEDIYIASLKQELAGYGEEEKNISVLDMSSSKEVEIKKVEGRDCAYVWVAYSIKGKEITERSEHNYILRKDEGGNWRILGFYR